MDKAEMESKFAKLTTGDSMATDIIRDYMKTNKRLWLVLVIVILLFGGYVFFQNFMPTKKVIEADLKGVYNLVDSDGNVIASDITPEELSKLVGELDG